MLITAQLANLDITIILRTVNAELASNGFQTVFTARVMPTALSALLDML